MKVIGIIPARGGSKGLPGKNLLPFGGKPLIVHTIEMAQYCLGDDFVVLTDSREIKRVAEDAGANVIDEPPEMASDNSPVIDGILYALNKLGEPHVVVLMEATSPLRSYHTLRGALAMFLANFERADSLVCVSQIKSDTIHPYGMKLIEDGYLRPFIPNSPAFTQRQQLGPAYGVFGGIYISKVNTLREKRTFYHERTMAFQVKRWQQFELDDTYDYICIQAIYEKVVKDGSLNPRERTISPGMPVRQR